MHDPIHASSDSVPRTARKDARNLPRLAALAFVAMAFSSAAWAQSTGTHIFGWAPAGQTVVAKSATGMKRKATVAENGRYQLRALATGVYTVTLMKDDAVVDTRKNIPLTVGRGAEVDFACPNDQCAAGAAAAKSP